MELLKEKLKHTPTTVTDYVFRLANEKYHALQKSYYQTFTHQIGEEFI